jgi:hypothetical protein
MASIRSNNYYVTLNGLRVIDFTTATSSTTVGDKVSALISTNNSKLNKDVFNTVVLGGYDIIGATSNSVYVPKLYVKDGGFIKGTKGDADLKFTESNEIILDNYGYYTNGATGRFAIISSSGLYTGSDTNGIIMVDNLNYFSSPDADFGTIFIGAKNAGNTIGIRSSIVIGGDGIVATQSNTIYLGAHININSEYFLPTSDGLSGQVMQTDGSGNTFWGNPGGSVIEITASSFSVLTIFEPNTTYKILDADSDLYGGTEIYLTTNASGVLNETGVGKFYNPIYYDGDNGFPIWVDYNIYESTEIVIWGGRVWSNKFGNNPPNVDKFTLDFAEWTLLLFDDTGEYYNIAYDEIKYDWKNDLIIYRNEKNSNIVSFTKSVLDQLLAESDIFNPIKAFQWGNLYKDSTGLGIGRQNIINSYNENINFNGDFQIDFLFTNYSKQYNCSFTDGAYQKNIFMSNY